MTTFPEKINTRKIVYLNIQDSLLEFSQTVLNNWVVFIIADDITNPILRAFANLCIDKSVLYMHATGKACSETDDLFDWISIERQEQNGKLPNWMTTDEDVLMTSWDYDFSSAFWFITTAANYDDHPIDTVLVANFTSANHSNLIQELIVKINSGWLPD